MSVDFYSNVVCDTIHSNKSCGYNTIIIREFNLTAKFLDNVAIKMLILKLSQGKFVITINKALSQGA